MENMKIISLLKEMDNLKKDVTKNISKLSDYEIIHEENDEYISYTTKFYKNKED